MSRTHLVSIRQSADLRGREAGIYPKLWAKACTYRVLRGRDAALFRAHFFVALRHRLAFPIGACIRREGELGLLQPEISECAKSSTGFPDVPVGRRLRMRRRTCRRRARQIRYAKGRGRAEGARRRCRRRGPQIERASSRITERRALTRRGRSPWAAGAKSAGVTDL